MLKRTLKIIIIVFIAALALADVAHASSTFGNEVINDCTLAAAGNMIQAETDTEVSEQSIVNAYNELTEGSEEGISLIALAHFWSKHRIDGYKAHVEFANTSRKVMLEAPAPLIATLDLGYHGHYLPNTEHMKGLHAVFVASSDRKGPLIVTWGEHYRISWSDWNAMQMEAVTVELEK